MLSSLRHRNFRLFFFGQGVSLVGTWMQSTAMPWLVYQMTGSVLWLGVVGFTGQILTFVMAPLAGVLADRWNRRRLVLAAQTLAMLQALALAALTLTGRVEVWHIVALSVLTGFIRGFEVPTRQSFVIEMVGSRADLPNAIALNSFLVNGARMVGPPLAGGILALIAAGEPGPRDTLAAGAVFLINSLTYLPVIGAFLAMRVAPRRLQPPTTDVLGGLVEGFRYAAGHAPIRSILLLVSAVSLVGVPYTTLMPVFAKDVLGGGPETYGYLMGATGVGALVGAIYLASRKRAAGLGRAILGAAVLFGAGLVAFGLSRSLWLSLPLLAAAGAGMMMQMAGSNTLLQTLTDEDKRGRVMSFYTMAFMGMVPFGALLAGWLAHAFGPSATVILGGVVCVAGALVFGRRLPGLADAAPAQVVAVAAEASVPPTAENP